MTHAARTRPGPGGLRSGPVAVLGALFVCMAAGGILHLTGRGHLGDTAWILTALGGVALSIYSTVRSAMAGRLGVDLIALMALVGALAVGEYLAGAVIAVMLATGQALESWAAGQARRDLQALLERAPRSAHRLRDGSLATVDVDAVCVGDRLMVGSGELVPVDGVLRSPAATLDESALTGEPLPVERSVGGPLRSGVANAGAPIDMEATAKASESTYAGIVRLVTEAEQSQVPMVRLADRYAVGFLGVTLVAAGAAWIAGGATRAVAVLVVATPCPLILAAPVAFVSGLSRAARRGIVVKGGGVLERLARCTTLLIDKTGTVTVGHPVLTDIVPAGAIAPDDLLALAGSLDQVSPHVVARSLVRAALARGLTLVLPSGVEESPGLGIRGRVDGQQVAVGSARWVGVVGSPPWARSVERKARLDGALTVFVAADDEPVGALVLDDPLRSDAARTIRSLRSQGIERIVMISGDRTEVADMVGAVIGVDAVLAERSPAEKVDAVRSETSRKRTIMVGDGINDAPALALADVGVAMGAQGATASSEAADIVLTVDYLGRLGEAFRIARRTRTIAIESMVAGMALSLTGMVVALMGYLPAVWGALLQEVIDVAVIVNSLRALRGDTNEIRLSETDVALTRRFQDEHLSIRADVDRIRNAADLLGTVDNLDALAVVVEVYRILVDEVQPHEDAEEQVLYPAIGRVLGGDDPMGTMSRAHLEINHRIRRLGQLLTEFEADGLHDEDLADLRGALYGLHAILKLHTTQEEESYLSLVDAKPVSKGGVKADAGLVTEPPEPRRRRSG
jgi:heavy metal translocating P-type ATPase